QIAAAIQMFVAAALILAQAHFGAGNTKFVMIVEGVAHVVCLVPVAWLLALVLDFDFLGVWLAVAAYVATLAVVFAWKFWEGSWKSIEV
ncbi:MAG: MATE family efflux transporter, partial [Bradymonadaceae bacterium]